MVSIGTPLSATDTQLRLFGKPEVHGQRHMGVALTRGSSIEEARDKAKRVSSLISVS